MKFTDSKIKGLKPTNKRITLFEDTGLGIRISSTGRKTFIYMYRHNGKQTMLTIGKYPLFSLSRARLEAASLKEKVGLGIDPNEEIKIRKKASHDAHSVNALVEEFIEKWSKPRKRTWEEDQRCLQREVVPYIGTKKAKDIRRRDIILILDRIVDRGSPGMANRTLNVITKLFNFAVSRDILDTSPCVAISMPAKKNERDRALDEVEIHNFWNGLPDSGISIQIQLALKLLLATGQRRGEIISADRKEFDLKKSWWEIPASKTKSERSHRIPLNKIAMNLLEEIISLSGKSQYIFPSPRTGIHIDPRAVTRALKKAQEYFRMDEFTPHDLRRTCATHLAEAGVSRLIVGQILNHKEDTVTGRHYDKYAYSKEKEQALETWSRKLESIISGKPTGKIIELKR